MQMAVGVTRGFWSLLLLMAVAAWLLHYSLYGSQPPAATSPTLSRGSQERIFADYNLQINFSFISVALIRFLRLNHEP